MSTYFNACRKRSIFALPQQRPSMLILLQFIDKPVTGEWTDLAGIEDLRLSKAFYRNSQRYRSKAIKKALKRLYTFRADMDESLLSE